MFVPGVWVTRPRLPPHPYMVEPFNNLVLHNQWADCDETWYVAFGTPARQLYTINDPGLTFTYFPPRSNLIAEAFVGEKVKMIDFFKLLQLMISKLVNAFSLISKIVGAFETKFKKLLGAVEQIFTCNLKTRLNHQ